MQNLDSSSELERELIIMIDEGNSNIGIEEDMD